MDAGHRQTNGPEPSPVDVERLQGAEESADQTRAIWLCRVLSFSATLLGMISLRGDHVLAALGFGALGFGVALVLVLIDPDDGHYVTALATGLPGVVIFDALFVLIGIG